MFGVHRVVSVVDRAWENIDLTFSSLGVRHSILITSTFGNCYDDSLHLGIIIPASRVLSSQRTEWYIHFASCFLNVIYDVFMHNNAFWSNSNAFYLIICKVHTKRENSGSWKSGPRKATSGYLFCTTPNKMKLYGYFFMEYMRNIGANKYQRGPTRWAQPT